MHHLKTKLRYSFYRYIRNIIEFGANIDRHKNFYKNAQVHPSVKLLTNATVENFSGNLELITIGENTVIRGELMLFAHAGKIQIGKDCYVGEDTRIWSAASIKIGDRVLISHNVNVHDTNSHSTDAKFRHQHFLAIMSTGHPKDNDYDIQSKPILIEDDVWIGFNSTILKGVKLGKGSIVAACSVVTKDVPAWTVVAGNPARVIREIPENER